MNEIIDIIKVAEKIKEIMLEKNITIDDLAKELGLRKNVINNNLNGHGTFDYNTLKKISAYLKIPLSDLLCQVNESSTLISEYEALALEGLAAVKKKDLETYSFASHDIYGKVFIEYALKYDAKEIIKYLVDNKVCIINTYDVNAQAILLKFIKYLLVNNIKDVLDYMIIYAEINHGFFSDEKIMDEIFCLIDTNNVLIQTIYNTSLIFRKNSLIKRPHFLVSNQTWIKMISKNHLDNSLSFYFKNNDILLNSLSLIENFANDNYLKGLEELLNALSEENILFIGTYEEAITSLLKTQNIPLIKKYIDKGFINSIDRIVIETIKKDYYDLSVFLFNNYPTLDYRIIGYHAVLLDKINIMKLFIKQTNQDNLNYFLSIANLDCQEMLTFLTSNGAVFDIKYLNNTTISKANKLILNNIVKKESEKNE